MHDDLVTYYQCRAREYERIYHRDDPTRQAEQQLLETAMIAALRDRQVLEIACGTGYWTQRLAPHAARILALDAAPETLEVARSKTYPAGTVVGTVAVRVEFQLGDAYALEPTGAFDGGLSNFWLSHVPKSRLETFLRGFHACLEPGARVFMADNVYYPQVTNGVPFSKAGLEDTFALRTLEDGSSFEIIKNYYDAADLERMFAPHTTQLQVHVGTCFWWVSYTLAA